MSCGDDDFRASLRSWKKVFEDIRDGREPKPAPKPSSDYYEEPPWMESARNDAIERRNLESHLKWVLWHYHGIKS